MNSELIHPFIEASQSVLKLLTGLDLNAGEISIKDSPYKGDNVVIIVGITGNIRGQAMFSMNIDIAIQLASKMMGGYQLSGLDEIANSAIAELTNMILGNTATILYNKGLTIDITPPSLVIGENMLITSSKTTTICVPLYSNEEQKKIMDIDLSILEDKK